MRTAFPLIRDTARRANDLVIQKYTSTFNLAKICFSGGFPEKNAQFFLQYYVL
jgi:hypothetical protein